MAYPSDPSRNTRIRAGLQRGLLRWAARMMIVFCLIGMGLVILSEPQVSSAVKQAADQLAERLDQSRTAQVGTSADAASDATRPAVRTMPTDRIPVRRLIGQSENPDG